MRPKAKPEKIGQVIGEYLGKAGLAKRLDLASAVERWAEVVGPQVASATEAESVTADGVLWVRVKSSSWANELSLMAPRILAGLNEGKTGKIRALRCVVKTRV